MPSNKLIGFEVLKNVYDEAVEQYQPLDKNNDKQEYAGVNIIYAVLVRLATFFYYIPCSLKFTASYYMYLMLS